MTTKKMVSTVKVVLHTVADILWRSFGLAWYVVPTGMGIGSVPALGTNWITGGLIAFGASFIIAAREMGKEIAMTSKLSMADVARAFRKAIAQQEQADKAQAEAKSKN